MSRFPLKIFTKESANVDFNAEYRTAILGRKFAGQPKGAYVGFTPRVVPATSIISLDVDPTSNLSIAKIPSDGDPAGIDVYATTNITFNVSAIDPGEFPLNVLLRATYTDDADTPTTAEIVTTSAADGVTAREVRICRISGTPAAPVVSADPAAGERDEPLALSGNNFGFMPAGSVEDLAAAVDIVNEVVAARIGLDGTVYSSLSDRLTGDQSAEQMGARLGLSYKALRGNDYVIAAGAETLNVSGSFSEVDRDHLPLITLGGLGSETSAGAISDPNDTDRNVCLLQDALTGYRPVDDPINRRTVFGRLTGPEDVPVAGTWTFTRNSQSLVATGATALSDFQVGDTVIGPDGLLYEVETVNTNSIVTLKSAYRGDTTSSSLVSVRRWTLQLKKLVAGVEVDASLATPTTLRFFFPAFVSAGVSSFDYNLALHTSAERAPLEGATTSTPGRVTLADSSSKLGSITLQDAGVTVGQFHTLVFSAPNALVSVGSELGIVEIEEIGPTGVAGPNGAVGAPGPTGPTGPGFSTIAPYVLAGRFSSTAPPAVQTGSTTVNLGLNTRIVCANVERIQNIGGGGATAGVDLARITGIQQVSPPGDSQIQVDYEVGGGFQIGIYLSGAGD